MERRSPAVNALRERAIDVLESLFGDGVALFAQAVEDAARDGFVGNLIVLGFEGEEGVFERGVRIGWI